MTRETGGTFLEVHLARCSRSGLAGQIALFAPRRLWVAATELEQQQAGENAARRYRNRLKEQGRR